MHFWMAVKGNKHKSGNPFEVGVKNLKDDGLAVN